MEGSDFRSWDELIPDALGLIFCHLSFAEVLTVVPRVCKSWSKVVRGPYCWQEINIEDWSNNRCDTDEIERMTRLLITRSNGSVRELSVSHLQNDLIFSFIADNSRSLRKLRLPNSKISDSIVEQVAEKLSNLTFLDLSYCGNIRTCALEAIGKHCKWLEGLCWNTHPLDRVGKEIQKDEAHAIATTMPKLKHLEIAYLCIDTNSVLQIIYKCPELVFLDLRGCWDVKLDYKWLKEIFSKLVVLGPHVIDHLDRNGYWEWEDSTDYSDSVYDYESLDDDGTLELAYYDGQGEGSGYGWPPSP